MANTSEQTASAGHPTPKFFWQVGLWLAIITGVEIWLYYMNLARSILIPALIILSLLKFVMVVAYFMHLKWDAKTYTGFFLFGFTVAVLVYIAVVWMSGPAPVQEAAAALLP